jgi:hypothetical protein
MPTELFNISDEVVLFVICSDSSGLFDFDSFVLVGERVLEEQFCRLLITINDVIVKLKVQ